MTREELTGWFGRRQEHWRTRDVDGLTLSHAPAGRIISPLFGTISGRQQISQSYRRLFHGFTDWTYLAEDLVLEPGDEPRAGQFLRGEATHINDMFGVAATHRRIEVQFAILFEFDRDGLIDLERRHYDFTSMLVQVGALRPRPG